VEPRFNAPYEVSYGCVGGFLYCKKADFLRYFAKTKLTK